MILNELLKVDNVMNTTGNINHNHCVKADPDNPLPFCYTTDRNVRWEYCDCDYSGHYGGPLPYNFGGIYSSNRYLPWANSHYNPYGPYGYAWHSEHQHGRCSATKTITGSVILIEISNLRKLRFWKQNPEDDVLLLVVFL